MFPRLQMGNRFNFGGMLGGPMPVTGTMARPQPQPMPVNGTIARPPAGPVPVTGTIARPMPMPANPAAFNAGQFIQGGQPPIAGPYMPFGQPQRRPVTGAPMTPPMGMRSY